MRKKKSGGTLRMRPMDHLMVVYLLMMHNARNYVPLLSIKVPYFKSYIFYLHIQAMDFRLLFPFLATQRP